MKNKFLKKFGETDVTIEIIGGVPMFELYSTGMALGYVNYGKNKSNPLPHKSRINKIFKNAEIKGCVHGVNTFITENELYDFMLEARTAKCKDFKKWLTNEVLPDINKTGSYVDSNRVDEFAEYYLRGLSEDTKVLVIQEMHDNLETITKERNELKDFYDQLLSTEGLLPMNIVAKELGIGLKRMYTFLRQKDIMFYKGNVNVPYQRFMEQGLFKVKETPCKDGNYRPQTYATTKGLEYIRKQLKAA